MVWASANWELTPTDHSLFTETESAMKKQLKNIILQISSNPNYFTSPTENSLFGTKRGCYLTSNWGLHLLKLWGHCHSTMFLSLFKSKRWAVDPLKAGKQKHNQHLWAQIARPDHNRLAFHFNGTQPWLFDLTFIGTTCVPDKMVAHN